MRAYFFVNSWLSRIQKGLQVAHCVAEMANKAMIVEGFCGDPIASKSDPELVEKHDNYCDWTVGDKTIIILEGGSHDDLENIKTFFQGDDNLMWASFHEDYVSLNGAMTCVGIIVPPKIYETAKAFREGKGASVHQNLTDWELKLIDLINSKELAR